jgi:tetratricopeptide (TPR) repeat protein
MSLVDELDHWYGFPNADVYTGIVKQGLDKTFTEVQLCKLGLLAAMEPTDGDIHPRAPKLLALLRKQHESSGPLRLLQWVIQIQSGRGSLENLTGQVDDWAKAHPEDLVYFRTKLWIAEKQTEPIELIGQYVIHLEMFWDDDLAWFRLGHLYHDVNKYEQAAFAFEEAIALAPKHNYFYVAAAKARLAIQPWKTINGDIARKQLAKAVLIDEQDQEAWQLLIDNTTDQQKLQKFTAYRNRVAKARKTD